MSAPHEPPKPEDLLEHARYLRALARQLVRDESEVDELVQETWIEALKERPGPIERLRPWLAGVLRNLARERARGEGRRARRERESARSEALEPTANVLERIENFRVLARAVIELDEPYRSTIVQAYFEGLGANEIAARAGVPAATVRSRHKRALEQLRERLDRRYGDRDTWQLLFLPWLSPAVPRPRVSHATRLVLGGALLVALGGSWFAWRVTREPTRDEIVESMNHDVPVRAPRDEKDAALAPASTARREAAAEPAAPPRAPAARAPLELALRDTHTGEPVPEFQVELRDADGARETLTSDARGVLTSKRAYAAGTLELTLVDEPRLAAWRERPRATRVVQWIVPWTHAPGAELPTLDVEIGPTYRVELAGASAGELDFVLHGELAVLSATPAAGERRETRAPLRVTDGVLWLRFSNETRTLPLAEPWRLELHARERTARATVDVREGVARERVHCAWIDSGVLTLGAHDALGPARAQYTLTPLGPRATGDATDTSERGDAGELDAGTRTLRLDAGRYRVRVESRRHAAVEREFEIARGETLALDLALERTPGASVISGTLVFPAAAPAQDVRVYLCDVATDERTTIVLAPNTDDVTRCAFRFDDVPQGDYVVCARAPQAYVWEPGEVRVRVPLAAPAQALQLSATRSAEPRKLVLRVYDAETGAWIWHFDADLEVEPERAQGPVHTARSASTGSLHFGLVPSGAPFTWTVSAEGYRAARGDERAVQDMGDHLLVRVRLERGWASELDLVDARGAPLAHARVFTDGVERGLTDARGRVWISMVATPRDLAVRVQDARAPVRVALPRTTRDHARLRVQLDD